jgi:predicted metal-dependent phosphotriesterase family hydrolase
VTRRPARLHPHDHVRVAASGLYDAYPDLLGQDREARAIADLSEAKATGIDTILDATTFDLVCNAELLVANVKGSG